MNRIVLLLALIFVLPVWAADVATDQLVDVGSGKAVTFQETISPDVRYVIGWTLRPHKKNVKPIEWSLWTPDNPRKFLETYASYLPGDISADDDYELIDCIIDLKTKKLLQLPTKEVDYPGKHRGDIFSAWSPAGQGVRYALVQNDFQYSTENLWLITLDSGGMHQIDIGGNLQKAVDPIVAEKRPLVNHAYETVFPLSAQDSTDIPVAFHDSTVTIPFWSDVPKTEEDDTQVEGAVTVKLPEGTVLKASSSTPRDDPFKDVPELAKADHELNQVYRQLGQKLSSKQQGDLKHEQQLWIIQRDNDAAYASETSRAARNKSFLESTRQRITDLQDRLHELH